MPMLIWLSLLSAYLLLALLPLFFAELMVETLGKLHLSRPSAVFIVLGIILGGLIDIPVRRIDRSGRFASNPLAAYGFLDIWPPFGRFTSETVIAVNLGGADIRLMGAAAMAALANVAVYARFARLVPGVCRVWSRR